MWRVGILLFVGVLATTCAGEFNASSGGVDAAGCFPLTQGWGSGPQGGVSRQQWWCGADQMYGFLGFSYPLEDDCSAYSYNSFVNDFKNMKSRFGATFVRAYLPVCTDTNFWVNMVKAARDTSMGLIPMVFWDWDQNDNIMYKAENALLGVFTNGDVGKIAPYIIHSIAFGDELGEQGTYWVSRMKDFKGKLAPYNIPLTITDDWDRGVYKSGNGLSTFGKQVNDLSDLTNAHVMPYYHPDQAVDAYHMWGYFSAQLNFLASTQNNMKRPILVSQTLWAYNKDGHQRGEHDEADNMDNYQEYWNTINSQCATFKNLKIGWFVHSYNGEPGLDMVRDDGTPVFNFQPQKC